MWFIKRLWRKPAELRVKEFRFLCEQDGISERLIKSSFVNLFVEDTAHRIARAYLAQALLDDAQAPTVILGLRAAGPPDTNIVKELAQIFASQFGADQYLDIMFLSDQQEAELRQVCKPFFDCEAT